MATTDNGKIIIMLIGRVSPKTSCVLDKAEDLSDFSRWTRGTASEIGINIILGACQESKIFNAPDQIHQIKNEQDDGEANYLNNYMIYAQLSQPNPINGNSLVSVVVASKQYAYMTAAKLMRSNLEQYSAGLPQDTWARHLAAMGPLKAPGLDLDDLIQKAQIPEQVDAMAAIRKELDQTKWILHKSIEATLERGEKMDALVAKSDNLTATSKMFYTQAKKQNSCCVVM